MHNKKNKICKVCGLFHEESPWGDDGKTPSFEICNCCGVEFGYEDASIEGIKLFRKQWIASGADWFNSKGKPEEWKLEEQLKNVDMK